MAAVGVLLLMDLMLAVGVMAGAQVGAVIGPTVAVITVLMLVTMLLQWFTPHQWRIYLLLNRWSWQLSHNLQFGITAKPVENISLMHKSAQLVGKHSLQLHQLVVRNHGAHSIKNNLKV
jgi:hypothetical protein